MPSPARRTRVRPALPLCLALAASLALACGTALGAGTKSAGGIAGLLAKDRAAAGEAPTASSSAAGQQPQAVGSLAGGASAPAPPRGPSTATGSTPPVTTLPPAAGGTPTSPTVPPLASETAAQNGLGGAATAKTTSAGRTPASAGASKSGLSGGAILAAVIAALIALACLVWAVFRFGAFEPHWLLSWRHSLAEAGFRASATWAEFTDWFRLGH